jgi:hypothetical protein
MIRYRIYANAAYDSARLHADARLCINPCARLLTHATTPLSVRTSPRHHACVMRDAAPMQCCVVQPQPPAVPGHYQKWVFSYSPAWERAPWPPHEIQRSAVAYALAIGVYMYM